MASITCGEKFLALCLQPDSLIPKSAWSVVPHGAQKRSSQLPTACHSHALQWHNITVLASSVWQGLEQTSGKHPTCWQTRRHKLGWCNSDVFSLLDWIVQTEMEASPPCQPTSPLAWSGPGNPLSAGLFKLPLPTAVTEVAVQASSENVVALLVALSHGCP